MSYTIGIDYGSNSVRALVVDVSDGRELGTAVWTYETGDNGIILDSSDHNVARQNPADYLKGLEVTVTEAIEQAKANDSDFDPSKVIGVGLDATASTPLPIYKNCQSLIYSDDFKDNPNTLAWLWKDHTSYAEAEEITQLAQSEHPEYLAKCGGTYSSEWFFSKVLHCLRIDPAVYDTAYTWVEYCDWLTAVLTGVDDADNIKRGRCAAGHKAMYSKEWGGYPAKEFLSKLDPKLAKLHDTLPIETHTINEGVGTLSKEWSDKLGLPAGIPIAVGAIDAHLGAVGSGIKSGTMVKILGTSSCDMVVAPNGQELADIPGICGAVDGSILSGMWGLEAGQSAVGDVYNWFVNYIQPGGLEEGSHQSLTEKASKLKPAQSGLIALDWNNGNRNILADQRLTGLLIGQTLHTKPEEIYRALLEATAFGALTIINRFEEYGVKIDEIIFCGGIAEKNAMVMQIYADVTGRELKISRSSQTCALGAAIAAAVVAGSEKGGYDNFESAQVKMTGVKDIAYNPVPANQKTYAKLYLLYKQLHDAFADNDESANLGLVMKELLELKEKVSCK